MTVLTPRFVLRAALIGALALGLAACGRKGPLDPPPSAAADAAPVEQRQTSATPFGMSPMGNTTRSSDSNDMLVAPKGPKKPIILDGLLN